MSEISEAARQLKILREHAGLTMRTVSDSLGWSLTRYQHYEDRFKRKFLPFELARALDELFARHGGETGSVLQLAGVERSQVSAPRREAPPSRPVNLNAVPGQRDLPILGEFREGSDDFYFTEGQPKEFVDRPVQLRGVVNAFALYAGGEVMEPRYAPGELLYVNPNRPVTKNCYVAVELADGRGLVRQFLRRNENEIVLRQLNPEKQIHLKTADLRRVCRVIGATETH